MLLTTVVTDERLILYSTFFFSRDLVSVRKLHLNTETNNFLIRNCIEICPKKKTAYSLCEELDCCDTLRMFSFEEKNQQKLFSAERRINHSFTLNQTCLFFLPEWKKKCQRNVNIYNCVVVRLLCRGFWSINFIEFVIIYLFSSHSAVSSPLILILHVNIFFNSFYFHSNEHRADWTLRGRVSGMTAEPRWYACGCIWIYIIGWGGYSYENRIELQCWRISHSM